MKLLAAMAIIVSTVAVRASAWWFFAGILLVLIAGVLRSGIPPAFVLRRLLMLEPFVLGIAVLGFFQPGGLAIAVTLIVKSTLCLLTLVLLSNTTPFPDLLGVLRRAGTPGLLVSVLALMYRYVFVLIDEAERMHRARLGRTFAPGRKHIWSMLATIVGQLFVRSTERAERIYAAMLARGWK